jgi:hypothetical protein
MALVSQRAYARHRGISQPAVWKRLASHGGPIPVHGPKNLIDVAEADALWNATMSSQAAAHTRTAATGKRAAAADPPRVTGSQLAQARAAALVVDVQTKRLKLERQRGTLVSRDVATLKAFSFARMLRDAWLAWPARVGPQLAATFDLDATTVTVALEQYVRQQLEDLASDRVDF